MYSIAASQIAWQTFLFDVKQLIMKQKIQFPKIFISYAWDGDVTATSWLHARLTRFRDDLNAVGMNDFTEAGKEVFLDVSEMTGNLERKMRENLEISKVVLAICTPNFGERVTQKTNVAFEYNLTLERLAQKSIQVYPLWIAGSVAESIPEGLQQFSPRDCRDVWQHETYFAGVGDGTVGLLPALLGWTHDTIPHEYKVLWQSFLQTAFPEGVIPSLNEKLKSLLPSIDSEQLESFLSNVDGEPFSEWPVMNDIKQKKIKLPDWLKEQNASIRQRYPKSQAQYPVTVILEQHNEYREVYWSLLLQAEWDEFYRQGVLPLYIPLNKVSDDSHDMVSDYLMSQGFEVKDIERIQQHYAILLILSGFEVQVKINQLNLLANSRWQQWRGHTLILCDEQERQACRILDDYLQSHSLPLMQSFKMDYPIVPGIDISAVTQRDLNSRILEPQAMSMDTIMDMNIQNNPVVQSLTEAQMTTAWHQFLKNIKTIKPTNKTFFISQVKQLELQSRLTLLKNSLTKLGFRLSDNVETADNVFVICSSEYLVATVKKKQTEYAAIKNSLQNPQKAVYPLWFTGDNFGSSVPSELFKLLVRDCRDTIEDYFNWGNLDNPLGLIPAMLDIRFGTPQGELYQSYWQVFCKKVWGEQAHPSSLLFKLKISSRSMAAQETLYQSTKAYYQSPQMTLVKDGEPSGSIESIFNELLDKAQTNAQHMTQLLFAEPGCGKSMGLLKLEEDLWNQFHRYHLIPIRIPLNQINPEQNDFVSVWLKERANYSASEIKMLQKQYRFLILLDGYDEFVFEHGEHDVVQLANLSQWQGVSILSCRTQMDAQAGRMQNNARCYLCSFTTEQIDAYLLAQSKHKPALTPELRQKVHVLPGLIQLIKNPLMLYITSDILPDLAQHDGQVPLTRYSLYERFTHKWFQRELVRVVQQGLLLTGSLTQEQWRFGLLYFAEQIAVIMFREEKLHIPQIKLDAQAQALLTQMLVQSSSSIEVAALRNACPLKVIGTGYQFIHKSFQEFLVAQALLKALPLSPPLLAEGNSSSSFPPLRTRGGGLGWGQMAWGQSAQTDTDYFHAQLPKLETNLWNQLELRKEPAVLDFLSDTKPNYYRLLEVIGESKGQLQHNKYLGNPRIAQASGNAMTLFTYCGYSAAGLNFEHTQLQNADITQGVLMNASLDDAHWNNISATQSRWRATSAKNTHLKIQFGERAYCQGDSKVLHSKVLCGASNPVYPEQIAVGYENGHIVVWDINRQVQLKNLYNFEKVKCLAYTKDGQRLVSVSEHEWKDHTSTSLCVWELESDHQITLESSSIAERSFTCVAVIDNRIVLGADDNNLHIWDLATRQCVRVLTGHERAVTCVAVMGKTIVSGSDDWTLRVWDITSGHCTQILNKNTKRVKRKGYDDEWGDIHKHQGGISCVTMTDSKIISGSEAGTQDDGTLCVWDIATGQCERVFDKIGDKHFGIAYITLMDNSRVISMSRVFDIATGQCERVLSAWGSHERFAVVAGETIIFPGPYDNTLRIFEKEMLSGQCTRTFEESHREKVGCIALTDSKFISGSEDGTLRVWDIATGRCEHILRNDCTVPGTFSWSKPVSNNYPVRCLALVEDGEFIWSGGMQTLCLWNLTNGQRVDNCRRLNTEIECITVSNGMIAIGFLEKDHSLGVWDKSLASHSKNWFEHACNGSYGYVTCIVLTESKAISGANDGILRVWDFTTGRCEHTLKGHKGEISHLVVVDGKIVSLGTDKILCVWEMTSGRCLHNISLPSHGDDTLSPVTLEFHPGNPQWVVIMYRSGLLIVLDIVQGVEQACQQWLACNSAAIDLKIGRLVLGHNDGGVTLIAVSPPHYWNAFITPLPPWQIKWVTGQLTLDVQDLQLQGAQINDAQTLALLQQRGAVGEASIQALTPPQQLSTLIFPPLSSFELQQPKLVAPKPVVVPASRAQPSYQFTPQEIVVTLGEQRGNPLQRMLNCKINETFIVLQQVNEHYYWVQRKNSQEQGYLRTELLRSQSRSEATSTLGRNLSDVGNMLSLPSSSMWRDGSIQEIVMTIAEHVGEPAKNILSCKEDESFIILNKHTDKDGYSWFLVQRLSNKEKGYLPTVLFMEE